jgi:hypothetical protein
MLVYRPLFISCLTLAVAVLSGCDRIVWPIGAAGAARLNGIQFPADAEIAAALAASFAKDPNTVQARTLLTTLGGERGQLDYQIRNVVYRQGAYEAHYDVALQLGQAGADSLNKLYASMVPPAEREKLPQDLGSGEKWLAGQAQGLEKTDPAQAGALRKLMDTLGTCYRQAKTGDKVILMTSLVSLVSVSRTGWYAEKMPSPEMALRCLPA